MATRDKIIVEGFDLNIVETPDIPVSYEEDRKKSEIWDKIVENECAFSNKTFYFDKYYISYIGVDKYAL